MRVVLDASVAIKFYSPEQGSEAALAWLLRADVAFCAPDIFLVEVAQALLRHSREGRISKQDLQLGVEDIRAKVEVSAHSGALIERALGLAHLLEHRLHDCMYLALAERLDCGLLTADDRLVRKTTGRNFAAPVLLLTDPIS